jgi:hypothetical protein
MSLQRSLLFAVVLMLTAVGAGTTTVAAEPNLSIDVTSVEPDDPTALVEAEVIDRRFPVAGRGWRLYLLGLGLFTIVARRLQSAPPSDA